MARTVEIDFDECIGCQSCLELCPGVFMMDSAGDHALVIKGEVGEEEECVQEAIDTCPVNCIHWVE